MSQIKIRFVNFDRSSALETFTLKALKGLDRRLDRRPGESKSIEVQFKLDARAPLGLIKNSEVMISYRYPGIKKVIQVKRQGVDLRKALHEAVLRIESQVRRLTEKTESSRRTWGKTKRHVKS